MLFSYDAQTVMYIVLPDTATGATLCCRCPLLLELFICRLYWRQNRLTTPNAGV